MAKQRDESKGKSLSPTVGIKEIAQSLGVSIGTVDRALHSRPGINAMTRAKVLKMAETMGYRPNLAARFLKSRRQLRISVQLPREIASFFDQVRDGITEAAGPFGPAVHIQFRTCRRLGEGDLELFEEALADETHGMIICPGDHARFKPLVRSAARRNIPVVCVATDAPGTERLTAVSACPHTSGAVAGELLARFVQSAGSFAVITGTLGTEDHAEKVDGFRSSVREIGNQHQIAGVVEAHDDEHLAYNATKDLLTRADLRGIYVSTANSLPVLQAIGESGRAGAIAVVTTDLFPQLVPLIRTGRVLATVHQRPVTQGRIAFQALQQFLVEDKCPLPNIRVAPHIVMNSNLDLFLERLAVEEEALDAGPLWSATA